MDNHIGCSGVKLGISEVSSLLRTLKKKSKVPAVALVSSVMAELIELEWFAKWHQEFLNFRDFMKD